MNGHLSLLRPLAASAVLVLGSATPALAASSSPATASPDPSPSASSPAPDPYPGITHNVFKPPALVASVRSTPVEPSVAVAAAPTRPAARPKPNRPAHAAHRPAHAPVQQVRIRRPEPPAPSLGDRIFGAVSDARRVPAGAALAVALLVLLSGLFVARLAREAAR